MKNSLGVFTIVMSLLFAFVGCAPEANVTSVADVLYSSGKIYTVNSSAPWAEAIAVKDGKLTFVGSDTDAQIHIGETTEVIDLGGKFVMPGIHDTHLHFESFYTSAMLEGKMLTLPAAEESLEELQELLKDYADNNPDLEVLFGEGLRAELFPDASPTKAFIDEVVPDRPVVLLTGSEHETLHNSAALAMAGVTAETEVPDGGEIVIDKETGEPTGFLKESAAGKWGWVHFPQLTREQHREGMQALVRYLNGIGVTSGKQQHAKMPVARAFQDLEARGDLTMRIGLSWTYKGPLEPMPVDEQERMFSERGAFASELIKTEFIKLSIDGTAGTTGLVVDPYLETGGHGIAFYELDELAADIARFDAMGVGVTAHASGDGAVRLLLDGLERAKAINGELKARHQIAHGHFIHVDDMSRINSLSATVEFSPAGWFQSALSDGLGGFLGPERMAHAWPAASVIKSGGRVVFASDGPLMWQEPLHSMEATITRRNPVGDGGALSPKEAIDLETAIRAYTLDSAWLMNNESVVGSIEVGKRADFIVLDRNLFEIEAEQISDSKVLLTVFDGEIVYDAATDPAPQRP